LWRGGRGWSVMGVLEGGWMYVLGAL